MRDYNEITVSLFVGNLSKPAGKVNLLAWLSQKPSCMYIIDQIRSSTDKEEIQLLKKRLHAVTVSGTFSRRIGGNLVQHSGLICIDIDGKDNPDIADMEDLKYKLSKLPYVLYCGLSASWKGLFCVIPIADPNKHRQHFYSLEKDFQEMDIIIDSSCKDVTRLRFSSYDPKPVININAVVYDKHIESSSATRMPRKAQNRTTTRVSNDADIQHEEESIMSIEDYFLKPMVDVNSNRPIKVMAKSAKDKILEFVDYIDGEKTDITMIYDDWIAICIIMVKILGEDGRTLFQKISRFFDKYTSEECDDTYTSILLRQDTYKMKPVDYLYEIAEKYGL